MFVGISDKVHLEQSPISSLIKLNVSVVNWRPGGAFWGNDLTRGVGDNL